MSEQPQDLKTELVRISAEVLPNLTVAYSVWLETNSVGDPGQNQINFKQYLLTRHPDAAQAIELLLDAFFHIQEIMAAITAGVEMSGEDIADAEQVIYLLESTPEVAAVEQIAATI